jgi:hypothetical protein
MLRLGVILLAAALPTASAALTTDPWDVSQGAVLVASSGAGACDLRNMFGGQFTCVEPGVVFFRDDQPAGFTHFVEWDSASVISISGYQLVAADDSCCTAGDRGFTEFRLFVFDPISTSFQLVDTFNPASNPYPGNLVDVTRSFASVSAQRFRAEFDQFASGGFPGPRIVELDAVVAPEPSSGLMCALGASALGLFRRSSRRRRG